MVILNVSVVSICVRPMTRTISWEDLGRAAAEWTFATRRRQTLSAAGAFRNSAAAPRCAFLVAVRAERRRRGLEED